MTRYQTGGGSHGNRPAGAIVQLKTTVPYVDKVTNPEPATGGADAETLNSLMERSPRTIRHRERAVTLEDYEDLSMLASPAVARAKCVPLRNLVAQPIAPSAIAPGEVSVMIVPNSTDVKPLPSVELIQRVTDYLQAHSLPTLNISVVGPLYIQVTIRSEIALTALDGATDVEKAVQETLTQFLHPLTGGFEGTGWEFGREPYKSDFYRLLESIPGVDHVRTLEVNDGTKKADGSDDVNIIAIKATKRFLVYSGQHSITLTFNS
jgi:predicted phage baseplate assembly protein